MSRSAPWATRSPTRWRWSSWLAASDSERRFSSISEANELLSNSTTRSPAFQAFSAELVKHLSGRYDLSGKRVLDIGCGNGRQTRFLARHFQKVVGVDISAAAVELARRETTRETNV